jgi:vacuolar protein sorting-associated protein 13A/C
MKFPWKNIYTAPVELTLRDVRLVARPSQPVPYNQEEEERHELLTKMRKVEEMDEARRMAEVKAQNNLYPGTSTSASTG